MKVLYSSLKQYVPDLTASAREVADVLTLIGYMADRFEEVMYNNKPDHLISLEVRQNRADCFSVLGIAREVAAYYAIPFQAPQAALPPQGTTPLHITVVDQQPIKRILAIQVDHLKQQESPSWLKEFLVLYGMNSINLFVDLSNYVMILTGYSSHLIDTTDLNGTLSWSMNTRFETIETLDGSTYDLTKDSRYLLIHDDDAPIALAGIIGSRHTAISEKTTSVIAEMAVYDAGVIRDNMRSLHIATEAGNRLSKDIDSGLASDAFSLLISLLAEHGGGVVSSSLFEYYPEVPALQTIVFDPAMPSSYAGIDISIDTVRSILSRLSFDIKDGGSTWEVTVPAFRTDVSYPQDLAEEVIRIVGYETIPTNEVPRLVVTPDITPAHLRWADTIHDLLTSRGYDEIRSLPLVSPELNALVHYRTDTAVTTQNSVNEEYPQLRQSVCTGILLQKEQYQKRNVYPMRIFEYGKAFWKQEGTYVEHEMLALGYIVSEQSNSMEVLYSDVLSVLARLGIQTTIRPSISVPACANPYACWDIMVGNIMLGICFVLDDKDYPNAVIVEVDMTTVFSLYSPTNTTSTAELTTKLVDLDTNVVCSGDEELGEHIAGLYKTIGTHAWSIIVVDRYPLETGIRYTLRVTYRELSDTDAKALHNKTFELNT